LLCWLDRTDRSGCKKKCSSAIEPWGTNYMHRTLLALVLEDSVFVDHGEGWADAYPQVEIHCTELTALKCQSSCAALQSWMLSKPNKPMLQNYQQAVQFCYASSHPLVETSGTLYITTQSCGMTATCVFKVSPPKWHICCQHGR